MSEFHLASCLSARFLSILFGFYILKIVMLSSFAEGIPLRHLGCYLERYPWTLELQLESYANPSQAVQRCARRSSLEGYRVFGLRIVLEKIQCSSGVKALTGYDRYGAAKKCSNGTGGILTQDVYYITDLYFNMSVTFRNQPFDTALLFKSSQQYNFWSAIIKNGTSKAVTKLNGLWTVKDVYFRPSGEDSVVAHVSLWNMNGTDNMDTINNALQHGVNNASSKYMKTCFIKVVVADVICLPPVTSIFLSQSAAAPNAVLCSMPYTIRSSCTTHSCPITNQTLYHWKVYPLNSTTHLVNGPSKSLGNSRNTLIEPGLLSYGLYVVQLNTTVKGVRGATTMSYGFFRVVRVNPRLSVSTNPPDLVNLKWNKSLAIEFKAFSEYPSGCPSDSASAIQKFFWYCRLASEPALIYEKEIDDLPLAAEPSNASSPGCFGMGPGLLNTTDYHVVLQANKLPMDKDIVMDVLFKVNDEKIFTSLKLFLVRNVTYNLSLQATPAISFQSVTTSVQDLWQSTVMPSLTVTTAPSSSVAPQQDEHEYIQSIWTFKLTSVEFSFALTNKNSETFLSLSRKLVREMFSVFHRNGNRSPKNLKVENFEPGSVTSHVSVKAEWSISEYVRYIFTNTIKTGNLGNFTVDPLYLIMRDVSDYGNCSSMPSVKISNLGKSFETATPFEQSRSHAIDGKLLITNCTNLDGNFTFKWTIMPLNAQGNITGPLVDVSRQSSQLELRNNTLEYGYYMVWLRVSILGDKYNLTLSDFGLLQIIKPQIVAIITGGNMVTRQFSQPIILDASQSYDPDVGPSNYDRMNFTWFCRIWEEKSWPEFDLSNAPVKSQANGSGGGCFGTGIGRLATQGDPKLIKIEGGVLAVNRSYVFLVVVSKKEKGSIARQIVKVTPDIPSKTRFICTFKLTFVEFSFALTNKSSREFQSLSKHVVTEMYAVFERNAVQSPSNLKVNSFEPGSVISHVFGEVDSASADQAKEVFTNTIRNGSLGNFTVDPSYIIIKDVSDDVNNCTLPSVKIPGLTKNISTAVFLRRSRSHTIKSKVLDITCVAKDAMYAFKWTVTPADAEGNAIGSEKTVNNQSSQLNLPRNSLKYGVYIVKLSLSIYDNTWINVTASDFVLIKIVASPLVAHIAGGNLVRKGFSQPIRLDASKSRDPDVGRFNYEGMTFTWLCRIRGENWPSLNLTSLPVISQTPSSGAGCFGTGIGKIESPVDPKVLTIGGGILTVNRNYEFVVVVGKDDRRSTAVQVVQIVPGDPPNILLRCNTNCGISINPSSKLGLEVTCQGNGCRLETTYSWDFYKQTGSESNGDPIWQRLGNVKSMLLSRLSSPGFVVRPNHLEGGTSYRCTVTVSTPGFTSSYSEYTFNTNEPPKGGRCSISPLTGEALVTSFSLSCSGWSDPETPLKYQFRYRKTDGAFAVLYHGAESGTTCQLPAGPISVDYYMKIEVLVSDSFGASNATSIRVQVQPRQLSTNATVESTLEKLTVGQSSNMANLIKSGNVDGATQVANAVLDVLDGKDDQDDSSVSTSSQKKIVSSIIDQMAAIKVENIQTLTQVSSVVISATKNAKVLSLKTQSSSMEIMNDLAKVLTDKSRDVDEQSGEINKGGQNLLYGIGNIWKAASYDADIDTKLPQIDQNSQNITMDTQMAKEESKTLAKRSATLIKQVSSSMLSRMTAGEMPAVVKTEYMSVVFSRNRAVDVGGSLISEDNSTFSLPSADLLFSFGAKLNSLSTVDTQLIATPHNPYSWDATSSRVTSSVISLTCMDVTGTDLEINNLTSPIVMTIPRVQNTSRDSPAPEKTFLKPNDGSKIHYRKIFIEVAGSALQMTIKPEEDSITVSVFVKFKIRPTNQVFDYKTTVPDISGCQTSLLSGCARDPYVIVIPGSVLSSKGTYFVGLVYEKTTGPDSKTSRVRRSSCGGSGGRQKRSCVEIKDPPTTPSPENVTIIPEYEPENDVNVTISVDVTSCLYWSTTLEKWTSEGCQAGNQSSPTSIQCLCNHLTSFGGDFLVAPNPIDFDVVFLSFSQLSDTKNFGVIGFVAALFVVHLIVLVLCRRADKKDREKVGPCIDLNQQPFQQTSSYEVTIETGLWYQSGTTANIGLAIYGKESTSDVIAIKHECFPDRLLLRRGNIDKFIIHSPCSFGDLLYVRVWHDSTGCSPSWFLREIRIQDTIAYGQWAFPCNRWLDVVRDDGAIERILPCQSKTVTFNDSFKDKTTNDFVEQHLWVSVLAKSPQTYFTRVQRATCCLSVLFSAMIANAMFYNLGGKSEKTFQLGPFQFSLRQIIIGIQSSLIVAPINLCIAQLFKMASKLRLKEEVSDDSGFDSTPYKSSNQENLLRKKRKPWFHWSRVVVATAYCLSFACIIVSAVFTIFYSMQWGTDVSNQWLASMVVSFVQDLFVIQPSKIVLLAVIVALLRRRKSKAKPRVKNTYQDTDSFSTSPTVRRYQVGKESENFLPLTEENKNTQKQLRTKQKGFFSIAKDILLYLVFLVLLCVVCYGSRTKHGYLLTTALKNEFHKFDQVTDDISFSRWLNETLIPNLYATEWYNSRRVDNKVYINDKRTILLGMPRMKQNRVQKGHCTIPKLVETVISRCVAFYTLSREDKTKLNYPGWDADTLGAAMSSNTTHLTPETCPKPWRYHTAGEIASLPYWGRWATYGGGGYVAHLGYLPEIAHRVINELSSSRWLETRSSAVLTTFSVFNVNTEYAGFLSFLYEKLPTGSGMASYKISSMPLYPASILFLTFQFLFLVFVLFYFVLLCTKISKEKLNFFKDPWNWLEFFILLFSVATVVLQLLKGVYTSEIIRNINHNPYGDLSFDYIVMATDLEDTLMAFLTFFTTIKLLKLIRLEKNILVISLSMRISIRDLTPQSIIFLVILLAYAQLGMLVFGPDSISFSSLYDAIVTELQMFIGGNSEIWILKEQNRVLGPSYIVSFMVFMGWIMMNIFVAILNEARTSQKKNLGSLENEMQFLDFMVMKVKSLFKMSSVGVEESSKIVPDLVVEESQLVKDCTTPADATINKSFLRVAQKRGSRRSGKYQPWRKSLQTVDLDSCIPKGFSEENIHCLHDRIKKIIYLLEAFEMDVTSEDLQMTQLVLQLESSYGTRSSRSTSVTTLSGYTRSRKPSYNYLMKPPSPTNLACYHEDSITAAEEEIRSVFPRPKPRAAKSDRFRPVVMG